MKRWNRDAQKWSRCPHPWCNDCRTRRGNNRGNRRFRHAIKTALRKGHEL